MTDGVSRVRRGAELAGRGRRALRRVVVVLSAVALVLPLAGGAAADPAAEAERLRSDLDGTQSELEDTREQLDRVEGERDETADDLSVIEARRAELEAELGALNAELADAQADLDAAEERLAEVTQRVVATEEHLDETRADLANQRERFSGRARAAYMNGGSDYTSAVIDVADAAEFTRKLAYIESVVAADRAQVEVISGLQREVETRLAELSDLQDQEAAQRQVAEQERDRMDQLVVEQEAVTEQVAAEEERHRVALAQLETEAAETGDRVAELQSESQALEAELQAAEAERRRQEEEAERRRQEEAEAAARREEEARAARAREQEQQQEQEQEQQVASSPAPQQSQPSQPSEPAPSSGRMQRPTTGPITSGYGYRTHPISGQRRLHAGVDFGAPTGTPIVAGQDGTVHSTGWRGGYGNTVVINHGGGISTLYAHQSRTAVSAGQRVSRGQVIGYVGSTGQSTGPHLHFEVRVNGSPRDPMGYL